MATEIFQARYRGQTWECWQDGPKIRFIPVGERGAGEPGKGDSLLVCEFERYFTRVVPLETKPKLGAPAIQGGLF